MKRIDTNIIVRYLADDIKQQADIAQQILENENVYIANEVLAEVIYVMCGVYEFTKNDICEVLIELIEFENIFVNNKHFIKKALNIFSETSLDFVDCLLCAYGEVDEIVTFDKKLIKCVDKIKKK
jgi:predicted nucleic-acid-binding protein